MARKNGLEEVVEVMPTRLRVTPLPGRLLIEEERPAVKIGRIHVPEQFQRKPSVGTCVAIGEGTATQVKIGDRIVYNMYSGTAIFVKGMSKAYRTLTPEECLVVVDNDIEIEDTGA